MISGWLDCPAFGEPIDKIIPSKVPLDETFNESVPPGKRYSSKQVVNKQRKAGREVSIVWLIISTVCTICVMSGHVVPIYMQNGLFTQKKCQFEVLLEHV